MCKLHIVGDFKSVCGYVSKVVRITVSCIDRH